MIRSLETQFDKINGGNGGNKYNINCLYIENNANTIDINTNYKNKIYNKLIKYKNKKNKIYLTKKIYTPDTFYIFYTNF